MDPSTMAGAIAKSVLAQATKPLIARTQHYLARRGRLRSRDALQTLSFIPGPHLGRLSTLSLVEHLPEGVTYNQIRNLIDTPTFKVIAQQCIAAQMLGVHEDHHARIFTALRNHFSAALDPRDRGELHRYLVQFDTVLEKTCAQVAEQLRERLSDTEAGTAWATSLLSLATVESIDRHLALVAGRRGKGVADREEWIAEYGRKFRLLHDKVRLPDLNRRRMISHRRLYVKPDLVWHLAQDDAPAATGEAVPLTYEAFLERIDRSVVLGDPGAGKSTMSSLLALRWLVEAKGLPFHIVMSQVRIEESGFSLVREIERVLENRYQHAPPEGLVEELLLEGSALIAFDGLDEIFSPVRRNHACQVIEAASSAFPFAAILVTSRRIGYDGVRLDPEVFQEYTLKPFTDRQVANYVENWVRLTDRDDDDVVKSRVGTFVEQSRTIPDLRQNPLMLAFMCMLMNRHLDIPSNRYLIYSRCIRLLLEEWDGMRELVKSNSELHDYEVALAEVGYTALTENRYQLGMTESEVRDIFVANLLAESVADRSTAKHKARQLIKLCRGRAWMFTDVGLDEHGEDLFAFTHKSFQEYFAAQHMVRRAAGPGDLADELGAYLRSSSNEVLVQICLSVAAQHFRAGASETMLRLLAIPEINESSPALDCLVKAADAVSLNGSAVERLVTCVMRSEYRRNRGVLHRLVRTDFRHVSATSALIAAELRSWVDGDDGGGRAFVEQNGWLWELCVREGVVDFGRHGAWPQHAPETLAALLFGGSLDTVARTSPGCLALWLCEGLLAEPRDATRSRRVIETLAHLGSAMAGIDRTTRNLRGGPDGGSSDMPGGLVDVPRYPAGLTEDRNVEVIGKALERCAGHRPEVLAGMVFVVMGYLELGHRDFNVHLNALPPSAGLLYRARRLGRAGDPPRGIERLPPANQKVLRNWIDGSVTLFRWPEEPTAVS